MSAAQDGRVFSGKIPFRAGIALAVFALVLILGINLYRNQRRQAFEAERVSMVSDLHERTTSSFRASFYFFFADQFIPSLKREFENDPALGRIQVITSHEEILFDSDRDLGAQETPKPRALSKRDQERLTPHLKSESVRFWRSPYGVEVLVPGPEVSVIYEFWDRATLGRVAVLGLASVALLLGTAWAYSRRRRLMSRLRVGLRVKIVLLIGVIYSLTGILIFLSLAKLQKEQETIGIEREANIFSRYASERVAENFFRYHYTELQEKFLPSIRELVAASENLISIRVILEKSGAILFEDEAGSRSGSFNPITEDEASTLRTKGILSRTMGDGTRYNVIVASRERLERPAIWVEFSFGYQTLEKSLQAFRSRILRDLFPTMLLGFLIALAFAQLWVAPIKKLVAALRGVSEGEFDTIVEADRTDEIGELVRAYNVMARELRRKRELKKYISDSTYRQIMESLEGPEHLNLKGSRVPATILFSDIRDFVALCESLEAEEVTDLLNEYFSEMVEVIHRNGGEVDKFIGDAILAVFYGETPLQAVYCAMEMREKLRHFNEKRVLKQRDPIEIGIGINWGEIISGPIGAQDRRDFTVIGDVVNLANRIEKLSKIGRHTKIVFSNHVEAQVRGLLDYELLTHEKIRGKQEDISVYELIRVRELSELVKNLDATETSLQLRSIEVLGYSANLKALDHLLPRLSDREEKIRLGTLLAIKRLTPVEDDRVLEALFSRLETEKTGKMIAAILSAVGGICRTDRILRAERFLDHDDERVVANAIEAIGQVNLPKGLDLILPKLGSRNNRIKANAAIALFVNGRYEVVETLKPMLLHSDPLMRASAAFAIGELTRMAHREDLIERLRIHGAQERDRIKQFLAELQECVPMLVSLLRDPDMRVKRQAILGLGKLKDRSAVLPLIHCIDFDNDSKDLMQDLVQALRSIGSHRLIREILDRV